MICENDLELFEADNFVKRFLGLFKFGKISDHQALYLSPCSSVHTFFMSYTIAVIFLDRNGVVIKIVDSLKPNRCAMCLNAKSVVECLPDSPFFLSSKIGRRPKWLTT